jgi:SAM-dependent methyltransferase/uncharacterized protein YbaR (Trm112 family)
MEQRLLELMSCPKCGGKFNCSEFDKKEGETVDGILNCSCGTWFPIISGIPRIVPDILRDHPSFAEKYREKLPQGAISDRELEDFKKLKDRTSKSFGFQWTMYKTIHVEEETPIFFDKTGFSREGLKGKLCLDAGCGYGRYSYIAAKFGAEVIAVDLSRAVESAYVNTRGVGKVHVLQGDLFNLPFKAGTFDYVYSIGVLHHTPDPRAAFLKIAPLTKKGGIMAAWVYKVRSPLSMFLNGLFRVFTTRMPHWLLWKLSWVGVPLGGLTRSINNEWLRMQVGRVLFFVSKRPYPEERWADTFDWWSPHFEHFHTEEEVKGWFEAGGFSDIRLNRREEDDIGRKTFKDDIGFRGIKK